MLYRGSKLIPTGADNTKLPLDGGTLSGQLTINGGTPGLTPSLFTKSLIKIGSNATTDRTGLEVNRTVNDKLNILSTEVDENGDAVLVHRSSLGDPNYTIEDAILSLNKNKLVVRFLEDHNIMGEERLIIDQVTMETYVDDKLGDIQTILESV